MSVIEDAQPAIVMQNRPLPLYPLRAPFSAPLPHAPTHTMNFTGFTIAYDKCYR